LQAANDTAVLDHFALLRAKYTANRTALETALGTAAFGETRAAPRRNEPTKAHGAA
jgi:hypothetical protein